MREPEFRSPRTRRPSSFAIEHRLELVKVKYNAELNTTTNNAKLSACGKGGHVAGRLIASIEVAVPHRPQEQGPELASPRNSRGISSANPTGTSIPETRPYSGVADEAPDSALPDHHSCTTRNLHREENGRPPQSTKPGDMTCSRGPRTQSPAENCARDSQNVETLREPVTSMQGTQVLIDGLAKRPELHGREGIAQEKFHGRFCRRRLTAVILHAAGFVGASFEIREVFTLASYCSDDEA